MRRMFRPYTTRHIMRKLNTTKNVELVSAWVQKHINTKRIYEGDSGAVQALITNYLSFRGMKKLGRGE